MFSVCWINVFASCIEELKPCWKACWRSDLWFWRKDLTVFQLGRTLMTVEKWIESVEKVWVFLYLLWKHCVKRVNKDYSKIQIEADSADCGSFFFGIRKKSNIFFIYNNTPKASRLEYFFPKWFFTSTLHLSTFLSVFSLQRHDVVTISATSTPKVKNFVEEYLLFPNFPLLTLFCLQIFWLSASDTTLYIIALKNTFYKPTLII